jgi:hypothetical protein
VIFITGVYFVNWYLLYFFKLLGVLLIEGVNILKNKVIPVIKLEDKGLTVLKKNEKNHFYPYSKIIDIRMNSNLLNGYK